MENVLKLKKGEKISIINSKNEGVVIKNENNILKVSETKKEYANIHIKKLSDSELNSFVLTTLLENNSCEIKNNKENNNLISKLLENQFNKICGKNYNGLDILDIEFQAITYYEKE